MFLHWIWLATRKDLGDHRKAELLQQFPDPETIYRMGEEELRQIPDLTVKAVKSLMDKKLNQAEKILRICEEKRISILTFHDVAYPNRLKNIYDPPVVLYYRGSIPAFDLIPVVAVVGTRKASAYGLRTSEHMGRQLTECGITVVSGVAGGNDAAAMKGALSAGGKVIGVLGCGCDVVYPKENRELYADTERYGCLISEFPPGTPPYGSNFPRRNRIMSGLSNGVVVVEAPERSGALSTARWAAEQGRDVFAIPGNVDNPACKGSNHLLKDGAIPVECGWDVAQEYIHQFPGRVRQKTGAIPFRREPEQTAQPPLQAAQRPKKPERKTACPKPETKKVIDKTESGPYIDLNKIESSLTPAEKTITGLLTGGQKLADDIIAESGLGAASVLASLTLLEVKGIVRRLPGRMYELSGRK
jgi:DNA processing protein